jgi:hypothetical protein
MTHLLGAVLACLGLQEGPALSRLGDDSLEVRERATVELVRRGRQAETELRRALEDPSAEVRARAAHVLAQIGRLERAREFEPGPSRITLRREGATLREVVEEIGAQSRTPVRVASGLLDRRVSASFDRLPLFPALEELCRGAGGLSLFVDSRAGEGPHARIEASPDARTCARDEAVIWAHPARIHGEVVTFPLHAGWEAGTKPWSASIRVEGVVDGQGRAYGASAVRG